MEPLAGHPSGNGDNYLIVVQEMPPTGEGVLSAESDTNISI
jgi:hypothetical protein